MTDEKYIKKMSDDFRDNLYTLHPSKEIRENVQIINYSFDVLTSFLKSPQYPREEIIYSVRDFSSAMKFYLLWTEEYYKNVLGSLQNKLKCTQDADYLNKDTLHKIFRNCDTFDLVKVCQTYVNAANPEDIYQFVIDEATRLSERIDSGKPGEVFESNSLIAKRMSIIMILLKQKYKDHIKELSKKKKSPVKKRKEK
jgi:hypothetical protein